MDIFKDSKIDVVVENHHSIKDVTPALKEMRANGLKRGAWLGFEELDKHWSLKRGSTTYFMAAPASGKTAFMNEIICNLVDFSDFKILIWSPETGSPQDIVNELMWSHMRRPFIKNKAGVYASDTEVSVSMNKLKDNIVVLDFERKDVSLSMIYDEIEVLKEKGFDADVVIIDPFTEIVDDKDRDKNLRSDELLGRKLSYVSRASVSLDIHTIICVHTSNLGNMMGKFEGGVQDMYVPAPNMHQIAGGQAFSRRGNMIVSIYRPKIGLFRDMAQNDDGTMRERYYQLGDSVIEILKTKPKVVGSVGKVHFKYDPISSRFLTEDMQTSKPCPTGFSERELSPNLKIENHGQKQVEAFVEKEEDFNNEAPF